MKQRYEQDLEDILQDCDQVHLVSRRDLELVVARHIRESLALSTIPEVRNARSFLDIGAGAGFPSIPLTMVLQYKRTVAVESNRKKALFLEAAVERLALPHYEVLHGRAEDETTRKALTGQFQTIVMRAVGNILPNLKALIPLLNLESGKGQILVPRGRFALERPREVLPGLFLSSYYVPLGKSLAALAEYRRGMEVLVFVRNA